MINVGLRGSDVSLCYFSLGALEETVFRKLIPAPFQDGRMDFKMLIFFFFLKESSACIQQFVKHDSVFCHSSLFAHFEAGANELTERE